MRDIVIVCAGNYGSQIYVELRNLNMKARQGGLEAPYNILGFIDDQKNPLSVKRHGIPLLGDITSWEPKGGERYVVGIGNPKQKETITKLLKGRGAIFETIIAKNSFVPDDVVLGEGCIINDALIGCGVRLGKFVTISGSMLYGGCSVGDYSTTTGFTVIENDANVGKRVFIGSKAVITEKSFVGDDARISAGSLVIENVDENALVFGVPAKIVEY